MRKSRGRGLFTRRRFMAGGVLGGAAVAFGCRTGSIRGSWESLTDAEARTLAALCDQIIPADDFPGATQAGVLTYIDRQLARHYRRHQDAYRDGLSTADSLSRKRLDCSLAEASSAQQFEIATALERQSPSFFDLVRRHTLEGFYGSPRHGGNRGAVSWRMLGLAEPPVQGRAQYDLRNGGRS